MTDDALFTANDAQSSQLYALMPYLKALEEDGEIDASSLNEGTVDLINMVLEQRGEELDRLRGRRV